LKSREPEKSVKPIVLVFTLTLFVASLLLLLAMNTEKTPVQFAEKGILDLRQWNVTENPILPLNGEWLLFPGMSGRDTDMSDTSAGKIIEIPSYLTSPLIPEKSRSGMYSFKLRVLLPENRKDMMALSFKNITPNYELRINGDMITSAGTVSKTASLSRTGNQTFFYPVDKQNQILDLVITISNFHNIAGGINRPVFLGDYQTLFRFNTKRLLLDSFSLGAVFIIAFYNLFLFLINPGTRRSSLFLGVICLMVFFFAGLKDQMILLRFFPFLDGEIRTKLIYLALCNAGGMIYYYARVLYPDHVSDKFRGYYRVFLPSSSLLILLTPMSVYSLFILPMEILGFGSLIVMLLTTLKRVNSSNWKDLHLLIAVIYIVSLSILVGIVDDAHGASGNSISMVFLVVIVTVVLAQAWEFRRQIFKIGKLEDSKNELTRMNKELISISQLDGLTRVANRRCFDKHMKDLWETSVFMKKPVGLIMADIDYFKNYNDYYGHQAGDKCLIQVADALQKGLLRQSDFLARYGGEEFAVVLSDLDEEGVIRVADNLLKSVASLNIIHEATPHESKKLTVSFGCAVLIPDKDCEPTALIHQADKALYSAKHNGRNQVIGSGKSRNDYLSSIVNS